MILTLLIMATAPQERFEAGDPAAALHLLEKAPQPADAVWRYNRALSAHAAGRLGTAIADYEWLTLRDPEDDAVRINRLLARLDRGAGDDAEPPLGQLARIPLRTLLLIALLTGLISLLRRRVGDALFRATRMVCSLCFVLLVFHQMLLVVDDRVVAKHEGGLFERPEVKARSVLEIPEGNLLDVVERQDDWVRVRTGTGVLGWIKSSDLLSLDGVGR